MSDWVVTFWLAMIVSYAVIIPIMKWAQKRLALTKAELELAKFGAALIVQAKDVKQNRAFVGDGPSVQSWQEWTIAGDRYRITIEEAPTR